MQNEIYTKLYERLNQFYIKVPPGDATFRLLAELYNEEDAELAIKFPQGKYTLEELTGLLGEDQNKLSMQVENMADKGLVFVTITDDGKKIYELQPWVPGVGEFSMLHGLNVGPEKAKKVMKLMNEAYYDVFKPTDALAKAELEAIKETLPDPFIRTLPIGEAISEDKKIHSYEDVMAYIEKETSFAAMKCVCRQQAILMDEKPCSFEQVPEHSCLSFGVVADYVVDRNFGIRITKEECIDIVKTCSEAGTVFNSNNFTEGIQFLCNCCGCCCKSLQGIKAVGNLKIVDPSNFLCVVDEDACIGCGDCVERCPVASITLDEDVAIVDSFNCIGCGNCVTICPSGALTLERQSDHKPVIGDKIIGMGF